MTDLEIQIEQADGSITTLRMENVVQVICRSTDDSVQFHVEGLNDENEQALTAALYDFEKRHGRWPSVDEQTVIRDRLGSPGGSQGAD